MRDVIDLVMVILSVGMIGVGLWLITPSAMFVGVGCLMLGGVWMARCGWMFTKGNK